MTADTLRCILIIFCCSTKTLGLLRNCLLCNCSDHNYSEGMHPCRLTLIDLPLSTLGCAIILYHQRLIFIKRRSWLPTTVTIIFKHPPYPGQSFPWSIRSPHWFLKRPGPYIFVCSSFLHLTSPPPRLLELDLSNWTGILCLRKKSDLNRENVFLSSGKEFTNQFN